MIKLRRTALAGHVARIEEKNNAHRLFVEKPEGKRPLRRHKCRCQNNIKMDLGEIGWGDMNWNHLARNMEKWRARVDMVKYREILE
jgi:hypothetical protein